MIGEEILNGVVVNEFYCWDGLGEMSKEQFWHELGLARLLLRGELVCEVSVLRND